MPLIDVEALISAVRSALPRSEPFAAIPLLVDQMRWLDATAGLDLLDRLIASAHPSTWQLTDDVLDAWLPPVAARAHEAIRALPAGEDRIEALCQIARRLTPAEQQEVLAGLLDGTYPETSYHHTKPLSRIDLVTSFVRTLPADTRETWVLGRAARLAPRDVLDELRARRDAGCLTEGALRDLWARLPDAPERDVPLEYLGLVSCLPPDLRSEALARIRACPDQSIRLLHLAEFDEELTDRERTEVVEVPWSEHTRDDPHTRADHLRDVAHHLPRVPSAVRRRWLDAVLAFEDRSPRQRGLLALLPSLSGTDRHEAVAALLVTVAEEGYFRGEARWDLLSDDVLPGFLLRLREDPYGWRRDGLIEHIWTQRPASTADRSLPLLLEDLDARGPDTRLEIVRALTPWLADRTAGAVPRALALLPVPASEARPDALYEIARVLKQVSALRTG